MPQHYQRTIPTAFTLFQKHEYANQKDKGYAPHMVDDRYACVRCVLPQKKVAVYSLPHPSIRSVLFQEFHSYLPRDDSSDPTEAFTLPDQILRQAYHLTKRRWSRFLLRLNLRICKHKLPLPPPLAASFALRLGEEEARCNLYKMQKKKRGKGRDGFGLKAWGFVCDVSDNPEARDKYPVGVLRNEQVSPRLRGT